MQIATKLVVLEVFGVFNAGFVFIFFCFCCFLLDFTFELAFAGRSLVSEFTSIFLVKTLVQVLLKVISSPLTSSVRFRLCFMAFAVASLFDSAITGLGELARCSPYKWRVLARVYGVVRVCY